mgnify:CR=1 FL=1
MTRSSGFPHAPFVGHAAALRCYFSCPTRPCGGADEACQGGGPWAVGMHKGAERLEIQVGSGGGSY